MKTFRSLWDVAGQLPWRRCSEWTPDLIRLHRASDVAIALAYLAIPLVLIRVAFRIKRLRFLGLYVLFAAFILGCGMTHAAEVYTSYWPNLTLAGFLKALTACVSWATVYLLHRSQADFVLPILDVPPIRGPMKPARYRWTALWSVPAVCLLVGVGTESYRSIHAMKAKTEEPRGTLAATAELDRYLELVTDAESGQRGYLLTGDATYLTPYLRARSLLKTGDGPPMILNIIDSTARQRLSEVVQERMSELDETVELRRRGDAAGAMKIVMSHRGQILMEKLRLASQGLRIGIIKRVEASLQELDAKASQTLWLIPIGGGLAVLAIFASLMVISSDLKRRVAYQEVIQARTDDLAREHAQAKQSEAKFRALLEFAMHANVIINSQGEIVLVNAQTEKLFGYDRSELIGKSVEVLIPHRYRQAHVGLRNRYIADPHPRPLSGDQTLIGLRKDGSEFPAEINIFPLTVGNEGLISSSITDVAHREHAKEELLRTVEELKRSNLELGQFAYVASHDLQEPLRMVASFTQLLARRYQGKLDANADEYVGYIVDGVSRMQRLINDLLDFARIGTQGKPLQVVDSGAVLAQVLLDIDRVITETGTTLSIGAMPTVLADHCQLGQVFQNLLSNAIKFHGTEPTRIAVSAESSGDRWTFRVKDNGIGIDPQYADRIFLLFQRLHGRDQYPGTGIGLAICKKIVDRHRGRIWVESSPNQGCEFFFTLPAAPMRGHP